MKPDIATMIKATKTEMDQRVPNMEEKKTRNEIRV
jgi:hypothetical protein